MKMIKNLINGFAAMRMTTAIHHDISTVIYKYTVDPQWLEVWDEPVWTWAGANCIGHPLAPSSCTQDAHLRRVQQPRSSKQSAVLFAAQSHKK